MISVVSGIFKLDTPNTTYMFRVTDSGHPEHLYYGPFISEIGDLAAYTACSGLRMPTIVNYSDRYSRQYMTMLPLEASSMGKGDLREPLFTGELGSGGNTVFDFTVSSWKIEREERNVSDPFPRPGKENSETLLLILTDQILNIDLELRYTVYQDSDVITRSSTVVNRNRDILTVRSLYSLQLDLTGTECEILSFDGAWIRERQLTRTQLQAGSFTVQSLAGSSSAEHNPLMILNRKDGSWMFNLMWSGDHKETVEVSPYGTLRILSGMNPLTFSCRIETGERISSPEAVMAYSSEGEAKLVQIAHAFISRHITPGYWAERERPVLLNSWEGMGFDLTEENVKQQADSAGELGIELFVMDDGWFRKNCCAVGGLGDWEPVPQKFPRGLKPVSDYIHSRGMLAGIWVEPEMISIDSNLYREHPDYLLRCPNRDPSPGRDQYLLNLTKHEVVDCIFCKLERLISENEFDYVKWDMNRYFSDDWSEGIWTPEVRFRWVLGLYALLKRLRERFPKLLMEGCSSGGSRYDLGMLSFVDQFWGSDNTDATCRVPIAVGTSFGYPQRTFGAHVSKIPNGITGRIYDYESAFNINAFGAFGYELDVTKLTASEREMFRDQISFYKQYRSMFQFGEYRLVRNDNTVIWTVTDRENGMILALYYEKRMTVSQREIRKLVVPDCKPDKMYHVETRIQWVTDPEMCIQRGGIHKSEEFNCTLPGALLKTQGMSLMPVFLGTEYRETTAYLGDYESRLFILHEAK